MDTDIAAARPARRALPPRVEVGDSPPARRSARFSGDNARALLRIAIGTKGCSGLSYEMNWVAAAGPGDETVTDNGVTVLVDRKATLFLIGTTMEFEQGLLSSGFAFTNPNEKGRCGCGESFHV